MAAILSFSLLCLIIKPSFMLRRADFRQYKEILRRIAKFSKVNIFLGAYYLGSLYILRKIIADNLGINKLGLFFAAFAFSSQIGLIVQSISFISISELSKNIDAVEKTKNINDYIYLALIVSNPILVMLIMWQDIVTRFLFSNSFMEMTSFLYIMFFCQFIVYSLSIFVNTIWTSERMTEHAIVSVTYHTLTVLLACFLITKYGLYGVAIGFLVGTTISHLLAFNFVKRIITFEFRRNVLKIMGSSAVLVLGSVILRNSVIAVKLVLWMLTIIYSFVAIEKKHKDWLFYKLNEYRGLIQ
jgi:O-antigen/teichoic acid export membrane protein